MVQTVLLTPAAIAGDIFTALLMRAKLYQTVYAHSNKFEMVSLYGSMDVGAERLLNGLQIELVAVAGQLHPMGETRGPDRP